jgi:hypothetical protein
MDDFFRSQQSPRGDSQMNAFVSPPRNGPQLPRRFTTDSGRVPTLSSITAAQRGPEPQDFGATTVRLDSCEGQWWEGAVAAVAARYVMLCRTGASSCAEMG